MSNQIWKYSRSVSYWQFSSYVLWNFIKQRKVLLAKSITTNTAATKILRQILTKKGDL